MKCFLIIIFLITFMSIKTYTQERFNSIYYDPDANISNTVIAVPDGYVVLTGTAVGGERGIGFSKISLSGDITIQKDFRFDGLDTFEGEDNCLKYDNVSGNYYLCGTAEDEIYTEYPFLILLNGNLDTIRTYMLNIDSVYGAYNVIKQNDSIYAIITQNAFQSDIAMGLILININNTDNLIKLNYNVEDVISTEAGSIVARTYDNFLLLGGFTFGFSTSTYKQDWYLIKTDSVGNVVWERYYGNPNENDGRIMALFESNDSTYIAAGGQAICNWSMNPISEAALRKIDTAGNLIWEKFYRRYDFDNDASLLRYSNMYVSDIIELDDRSLAATLNYKRADGDGGAYRFRLFKFDSEGNILFSRTMSNTGIEFVQSLYSSSIKSTADNGFIINGYGDYTWDFDPPQQFFLIKTDSLGCEGELYPAPPAENVECPDFPDTMYCDGAYNSRLRVQGKSAPYTLEFSSGELIENLYYPPVFIPKSQGTGSFTVHVGVDTYNHSYDTATLYNPIPAEDMEPDIIELPFSLTIPENYFGPDLTVTITNGYGESYEITLPVYVDCNVSAEQITENEDINIYPNPASDFLQISLSQFEENSFVKFINAQGQAVLVEQLFSTETVLNINELAAGSYVVRVYCGNKIENLRFEKM